MGKQKPTKPNGQKAPGEKFTPLQLAVLEAALNGGFGRSVTALCIEAGVSRPTFYAWLNEDEHFRKTWDELPQKILRPSLPGVLQALKTKAEAGDVPAIKLYLEYQHLYTPPAQRHEHSGPGGAPIQTETKLDLSNVTDDDLREYRSVLAKLQGRAGPGVPQN